MSDRLLTVLLVAAAFMAGWDAAGGRWVGFGIQACCAVVWAFSLAFVGKRR